MSQGRQRESVESGSQQTHTNSVELFLISYFVSLCEVNKKTKTVPIEKRIDVHRCSQQAPSKKVLPSCRGFLSLR